MPHRALVSLAASAALLASASLASAGGNPPAGNPPGKAPAAAPTAGGSYAALLAGIAAREAETEKANRRHRYDAVVAWLKANGTAPEAAQARESLVDMADEAGDLDLVVRHADEFLAAHAASTSTNGVRVQRARALGSLGREEEARKAFDELLEANKDDPPQRRFGYVVERAWVLAELGKVDEAKAALSKFKEEHQEAQQAVDRQMGALDAIGTAPKTFPAGVKDLDGKPVALGDYQGKILFLDFWATWCGPCVAEIPHVVAAYDRFHDQGFEVLGVTLDGPEDATKVRLFAAEHRMPWRQQHHSDPDVERNPLAEAFGVQSIPHTILLGRDGKILRTGLRGTALAHAVARALAREKTAPKK